jgi:hypothetical protein
MTKIHGIDTATTQMSGQNELDDDIDYIETRTQGRQLLQQQKRRKQIIWIEEYRKESPVLVRNDYIAAYCIETCLTDDALLSGLVWQWKLSMSKCTVCIPYCRNVCQCIYDRPLYPIRLYGHFLHIRANGDFQLKKSCLQGSMGIICRLFSLRVCENIWIQYMYYSI